MTQTPLEALDRLAERASNYHDEEDTFGLRASEVWVWKDIIRQALTGAGEPVGWRAPQASKDFPWAFTSSKTALKAWRDVLGIEGEPLFTSPQTPTPDAVTVRRVAPADVYVVLKEWSDRGSLDADHLSALSRDIAARLSEALQVKP